MPNIIPIKDLKNGSYVSDLCKKTDEPIFITKNGYGDMVIMSMEVYEKKFALLDFHAQIMKAEEDYNEGRVKDAFSSLKEMKEKYGI